MRTSNQRCSTPPTRRLTHEDPAPDERSPERHGVLTKPSRARSRVPEPSGGQGVADGEPISQDLDAESVDLARLAALLRRACGPSVLGAVVGRARLQDELARELGCSALMAQRLVDRMIDRDLIRQEVHRDGWVHWVVTI
jgi:hypothetical protein